MTTVTELLTRMPADEESSLRYNDMQVHIIEEAVENPDVTASDLHRYLQDEMEDDAPSQGYVYSVLNRAKAEEYKAETGREDEPVAPQTESKDEAIEQSESEDKGESEPSATVKRSGGTINISITIPEDAELDVEVEEEEKEPATA